MTYTVSCFLCRVSYRTRDQLEDHLTYQHGVVFNVDFVTRISQYRTLNDKLPTITLPKSYNNNSRKKCSKCVKSSNSDKKRPPPGPKIEKIKSEVEESKEINEKEQEIEEVKKVTLEESTSSSPQKSSENSFASVKVKPQNIRDKTNTYCNVCDQKLDSRILFLSHCSSVHDVKFKGKAGKPLIIPQDQEPNVNNKQPPLSTKSSPTSTSSGSPPKKKAKLSQNNSFDLSTPRRAPVPCQFCGKVFSNLSNKERHERQSCRAADKNKIEEKEFKCTIGDCSRNFSKIGYLKKHMSTDHENV